VIKVGVFYPAAAGATFDMEYYRTKHVPMVQKLLGTACKGAAIEQGLSGAEPGSPPTYVAMGHLFFESMSDFQKSFGSHAAEIVADVPNYTNVQPIIQISDVKM